MKLSIPPGPLNGQKWRCDICGKHLSELRPFDGAGDPLVGDFTGAKLVKIWRNDIFWAYVLDRHRPGFSVGATWECRDCILLNANAAAKLRVKARGLRPPSWWRSLLFDFLAYTNTGHLWTEFVLRLYEWRR